MLQQLSYCKTKSYCTCRSSWGENVLSKRCIYREKHSVISIQKDTRSQKQQRIRFSKYTHGQQGRTHLTPQLATERRSQDLYSPLCLPITAVPELCASSCDTNTTCIFSSLAALSHFSCLAPVPSPQSRTLTRLASWSKHILATIQRPRVLSSWHGVCKNPSHWNNWGRDGS